MEIAARKHRQRARFDSPDLNPPSKGRVKPILALREGGAESSAAGCHAHELRPEPESINGGHECGRRDPGVVVHARLGGLEIHLSPCDAGRPTKAVLTETGQAPHAIPLTSMVATWGAAETGITVASIDANASIAPTILEPLILNLRRGVTRYMPART